MGEHKLIAPWNKRPTEGVKRRPVHWIRLERGLNRRVRRALGFGLIRLQRRGN